MTEVVVSVVALLRTMLTRGATRRRPPLAPHFFPQAGSALSAPSMRSSASLSVSRLHA